MKSKKEIKLRLKETYNMISKLEKRRKSAMKQELLGSYRHISYLLEWVLEK